MKKKVDPRHKKRVNIVKKLFEKEFRKDKNIAAESAIGEIISNEKKIDKLISQNAPAWPINQIAPIDLVTLRLAIWELKFKKEKEPYKAIIDEAIEIAKEYGSKSSPSFVNGVLGTVIQSKSRKG